jgi:O-antigen/teichoic acid export membrane protein
VTGENTPGDDGAGSDRDEVVAVRRAAGSMRTVALTGGRWRAIEGVALQGLQVLSTMALARLLTPDEFGIVAVVTLVLVLFGILTDAGFGASVIRREHVDQKYLSSMFWVSSLVGVVALGAATLLAPFLASLAGNSDATPYLIVASFALLFGMIVSVPRSLLLREFRFKETSAAAVLGFVLYMAVAIPLAAFTPLGAWAIVLGRVASAGFRMIAQWIMSGWLPSMHLQWSEVKEDLGFNAAFLGMRGSQYVAKNIDYWYVGSALGSASLGTYYIAYVLPNLLRRRMTAAVSTTLFVTVTGFAKDRSRVRRSYLDSTRLITLAAYPVLVGMALLSNEMIRIAFGSQWLDAIEPMAILAVAAAVNVIGPVGSAILTAVGLPSRNIIVNLVWAALVVAGLVIALPEGGLVAVALVVLAGTVLSKVLQIGMLWGPISLRWGSVFGSLWPATATTIAMAAAVLGTRLLIDDLGNAVVRLVILLAVGVGSYFGFGFLAFRRVFAGASGDIKTMIFGGKVRRPATDGAVASDAVAAEPFSEET